MMGDKAGYPGHLRKVVPTPLTTGTAPGPQSPSRCSLKVSLDVGPAQPLVPLQGVQDVTDRVHQVSHLPLGLREKLWGTERSGGGWGAGGHRGAPALPWTCSQKGCVLVLRGQGLRGRGWRDSSRHRFPAAPRACSHPLLGLQPRCDDHSTVRVEAAPGTWQSRIQIPTHPLASYTTMGE